MIHSHSEIAPSFPFNQEAGRATLTVSRQCGTRSREINALFQQAMNRNSTVAWDLVDEDLPQRVLESHQLPADYAQYMPEDAVSGLADSIAEMLGEVPSAQTLFKHTVETVVNISKEGHAIVVGRGATNIAVGLKNVLRVRFVGSLDKRAQRVAERKGITRQEAMAEIKREDSAGKGYVRQNLQADIEDARSYDLVINTDYLSDETIIKILTASIEEKEACHA